jgi:DNA polymerase I-like protein with 3'-5' exonuclease and polymerase domains
MDFTALESVVLTELSRDKSMMLFYSPDANPHQDIHLFTTSKLPGIGKKVLEAGYNPDNPTPEGVENAKKMCKKEREVGKLINYASVYQAGGKTIARNLTLSGIPTSEEEGKQMHAAYWETFKGVKEYNRELERQWRLNGGWYLNGIGRPVCITEDMRKDLLSKGIQSTGHDCLVLLMVIYWSLLEKEGIEAYQWGEFHDQVIVEVIEHQAERAKHLLDKVALGKLNEMLGGLIPLRGEAQVIDSLAEAKNLKPDQK